jgi:hypothetical protein
MKVNETKSSYITFTLRKGQCPPVCIIQTVIPHIETVKYLGLHFDRRLTWKERIATKRKQLDHKTREIKWLVGKKNSPLSLENQTLMYKTVLRPVWIYGIELWGCVNKSNTAIMQRCQSKLLRFITNAPWYVTNHTLSLSNGATARGGPRPPSRVYFIPPGLGRPLSSFYIPALPHPPPLHLPNAAWVSLWGAFLLAR